MVAAVVVVLASAVVGVLADVQNLRKRCHRGGLSAVDLLKESGIDRFAVASNATAIQMKGGGQEVFVACHDVGQVAEGLGLSLIHI